MDVRFENLRYWLNRVPTALGHLAIAASAVLIAGCATPEPPAGRLDLQALQSARVGVAMAPLPKIEMRMQGMAAGCPPCLGLSVMFSPTLTAHVRSLPYEELPELKQRIAGLLRAKGVNASFIAEDVNVQGLPEFIAKDRNIPRKDYTPLQKKYDIDKLLIIQVNTVGVLRPAASSLSNTSAQGVLDGAVYLINLTTNTYEWYMPVNIVRSPDGEWNEPPDYPRLTKAYLQALRIGTENFIRPFAR